jgi:hypothetical protein
MGKSVVVSSGVGRVYYRKEYWKFLAQTVRRHRQHFSKAITLAIMGHHFFELAGREASVSGQTEAALG